MAAAAISPDGSTLRHGEHAVVIGASIAGLFAARVLADFYDRVTVFERDPLEAVDDARQGVPQGRHGHVLLVGGAHAFEAFFPGLFKEMEQAGAVPADFSTNDVFWFHHGVVKAPATTPIVMCCMTRPFLERHVRERVQALPNVSIRSCYAVTRLVNDDRRKRITGVWAEPVDASNPAEEFDAELVVDTSGRGSRAPQRLQELGYAPPAESSVGIHIGYASRLLELPAERRPQWKVLGVYAQAPATRKLGFISRVEGDRWLVTLAGNLRDYPPGDEAGFLEFAKLLDHPVLFDCIRNARPLSPIATHRFSASLLRHYERLSRFPEGFLVLGDAICSFNPIYGQGMSASALEAQALRNCLLHMAPGNTDGLWREFFRAAANIVKNPWMLSATADFLYPQAEGKRPLMTPFFNWYTARMYRSSGRDQQVATRFYEVMHLLKQPNALFDPRILIRVLKPNNEAR